MTTFIIEYRPRPTAHNAPQFITTDRPAEWLNLSGDTVVLSDKARRTGHAYADGTVVMQVYSEWNGKKTLYYKHGGYGANTLGPTLKGMLSAVPNEVVA
jgi:hypothetical protein